MPVFKASQIDKIDTSLFGQRVPADTGCPNKNVDVFSYRFHADIDTPKFPNNQAWGKIMYPLHLSIQKGRRIIMKETFVEQIHGVIRKAVQKYGTVYRLAQVTGINKVNIGRWVKGTPPRSEDVSPIMELMGAEIVLPDEELIEYDMVPKVAAKAGAGSSLETSGETLGMYAFRKSFLAREGIHAKASIMIEVTGDSMEPFIRHGDTILVDTSDTDVRDGMTYLVAYGDDLKVKHIFKSPQGLIMRSENPRYADVTIAPHELGTYAVIHGRVRWFGRLI